MVSLTGDTVKEILKRTLAAGAKFINFLLSPDRKFVVFAANSGPFTTIDVYSVPTDGSAEPTKLSITPGHGMDASKYKISADSQTVIYRADQDTDNKYELYSVPIDGSSPAVKISGTITNPNGDVGTNGFSISPDSTRVVFTADADIDTVDEAFSVPINGGSRIKLHANLSAGEDVFAPVISPNSQRVVYVAKKAGSFAQYSAAINATGDVKINDSSGGVIISGDSTRVIYVDDQLVGGRWEVFSVLITGGGAIRLSGSKPPGATFFPSPMLAPNGTDVVYINDEGTASVQELYRANYTSPSSPTKLSGTPSHGASDVFRFRISKNGNRIIYSSDQDTNGMTELYAVPYSESGSSAVKVNGNFQPSGDINFNVVENAMSDDGSVIVYYADQETNNVNEIYVNSGSGAVKVNPPVGVGDSLTKVQLTGDGKRVFYQKFLGNPGTSGLYSVPVGGGVETLISDQLTTTGTILIYTIYTP